MNKKHTCLFLAIFFLIINTIPYVGVFADDDIVIYDPDANTDITEQLNYDPTDLGALQIIYGILQNGSSVDFSNTSLSTSNNPWNDFIDYLTASVIGVDPEIWDDAIDSSLESVASTAIVLNGFYNLTTGSVGVNGFGALGIDYLAGLAQINNLGLSESNSDNPTPSPDVDYLFYIDKINGSGFWWSGYSNRQRYENIPALYYYPPNSVSWFAPGSFSFPYNETPNTNIYAFTTDILDINIFNNNGSYSFSVISPYLKNYYRYQGSLTNYSLYDFGYIYYDNTNGSFTWSSDNNGSLNNSYSGTLVEVFSYLSYKYRNVNIYVDGVPWSIVDLTPNYSISIGGNTYINNIPSPIQYVVPSGSYLDLDGLKQKIIDAILGSGVLLWQDIADCIVDVNGNQVITTYNVIRNDYDVLYREQYPETLIPDNNNYFNKNLLINHRNELNAPVLVVENTLDVLPSDLKTCLYICGILAIFALVINRLLE